MSRILAALVVGAAVVVSAPAVTAAADPGPGPGGGVVVTPSDPGGKYGPPAVDVGVGTPGQEAAAAGRGARGSASGGGTGCSYSAAPDLEQWSRGLPGRLSPGGRDQVDPASHLYSKVCPGQPVSYVWLTAAQAAAAALPSPEELARRAYRQLTLAVPVIRTSPAVAVPQLVRVPTWLWVDQGVWTPRSRTAAVPGLSATATARPVRVRWSMGDGDTVECRGPGTPFRAGVAQAAAASPDCGHTYLRPSAGEPGGRFPVTATVEWSVSWAGGGQAGTLPALTSTSSATLRVTEAQALNDG